MYLGFLMRMTDTKGENKLGDRYIGQQINWVSDTKGNRYSV